MLGYNIFIQINIYVGNYSKVYNLGTMIYSPLITGSYSLFLLFRLSILLQPFLMSSSLSSSFVELHWREHLKASEYFLSQTYVYIYIYIISSHFTSPHLTSPHLISPHLISPHTTLAHLTPP